MSEQGVLTLGNSTTWSNSGTPDGMEDKTIDIFMPSSAKGEMNEGLELN